MVLSGQAVGPAEIFLDSLSRFFLHGGLRWCREVSLGAGAEGPGRKFFWMAPPDFFARGSQVVAPGHDHRRAPGPVQKKLFG